MYTDKIENRIVSKTKTGYCLELPIPKTRKVLRGTKNKVAKNKNGKNAPHLEITEVILVHFYIANNDYKQYSGTLFTLIPSK